MFTFVLILHVLVCLTLVLVVLIQAGKGAEIGATFGGGGSQTVFGSRGPGTFLSKLTAAAGVLFMLTSLGLAILSSQTLRASVVEGTPAKQGMPAMPGGMPGQGQPATPFAPGKPAPAPAAPAGQPAPAPVFPAPGGSK